MVPSGGLADRAGDADAVEQFLLGADLAQPFVVGGGQRLAGDEAGAGIGDAQLRRLLGLVVSRRVRGDAGHRDDALLDDVVAVLQGQRILVAERQRLAQGGAELALLLGGIDAGFDRGLVPDRADAGGGDRRPGGAGGLRRVAAIGELFPTAAPTSSWAARATVMSAPIRVSQNGESGCFTETPAEPFGLFFDDHDMSPLAAACGEPRLRERTGGQRGGVDVELAPVQLQALDVGVDSALGRSGGFRRRPASRPPAALCALACSIGAKPMPAARISSPARP